MTTVASMPPALPADIDKASFSRNLNLWALKIDAKLTKQCMTKLTEHIFKIPRFKSVYEVPDEPERRYLLLNEEISKLELSELPSSIVVNVGSMHATLVRYTLTVGYDHLTVEEVLRQILPAGTEVPSSFEQIGHIAHMNLREEVLTYRYIIGMWSCKC